MAYSADTFVADEQPTTAKWNKLWSNDASFNDGSGLNNISNPITANSANHLVLTPGTNKLVKIAVLRQDDTTGTYKNNSIILTGYGVQAITTAGSTYNESVTYGITFDQRPIVNMTHGGDAPTASGSAYGTGTNGIAARWACKAVNITTTTFYAYHYTSDAAAIGANGFSWYQWLAIGELA